MTDQSDDEFDHDNLAESKVGISGLLEPHFIIGKYGAPLFTIFSSKLVLNLYEMYEFILASSFFDLCRRLLGAILGHKNCRGSRNDLGDQLAKNWKVNKLMMMKMKMIMMIRVTVPMMMMKMMMHMELHWWGMSIIFRYQPCMRE